MPARNESISRVLALLSVIILAITTFLFFYSTETSQQHLLGGFCLGVAVLAAAFVV